LLSLWSLQPLPPQAVRLLNDLIPEEQKNGPLRDVPFRKEPLGAVKFL